MVDPFTESDSAIAPIRRAAAISLAADTTYVSGQEPRGIHVGVGGDVIVAFAHAPSTYITFKGLPTGSILPVRASTIRSTANGTTATDLVAVW